MINSNMEKGGTPARIFSFMANPVEGRRKIQKKKLKRRGTILGRIGCSTKFFSYIFKWFLLKSCISLPEAITTVKWTLVPHG